MPALSFNNIGGINGVSATQMVPSSAQSRDRNRYQRFQFNANAAKSFTGLIHVQATNNSPTDSDSNIVWYDIAEIVLDEEGGAWSYEPEGEYASLRVVCKDGNYWSAAHGGSGQSVGLAGDFTINGISVSVQAGDSVAEVVSAINLTAGIITDGTIIADTVQTNQIRIYKTDGSELILADTTNTPLADLGFTLGSFEAGEILSIIVQR